MKTGISTQVNSLSINVKFTVSKNIVLRVMTNMLNYFFSFKSCREKRPMDNYYKLYLIIKEKTVEAGCHLRI